VKWTDIPFSTSGDSGSLVLAMESGVTIPTWDPRWSPGDYPPITAFLSALRHSVTKLSRRVGS
jgi:hypothetical protein